MAEPTRLAEPTRRRFLGGAAALVTAVALGACDADGDTPPATAAIDPDRPVAGDLDIAVALVQLERNLAAAYDALLDARLDDLAGIAAADRAALVRDHHLAYADSLAEVVGDEGLDPAEVADDLLPLDLPDERDVAELPIALLLIGLARLEDLAVPTHLDAVGRLALPDLRQRCAGIAAAEAGHAVAWDLLLGGTAATTAVGDDGLLPLDRSLLAGP